MRAAWGILGRVEERKAVLEGETAAQRMRRGLHECKGWVRRELQLIQPEIAQAFWPEEPFVPLAGLSGNGASAFAVSQSQA